MLHKGNMVVALEHIPSPSCPHTFFTSSSLHYNNFFQNFLMFVANVKLIYKELATILCKIEAYLNSRPLVSMPQDDDGIKILTPRHSHWPPCWSSSWLSPIFSVHFSDLQVNLSQALTRHFWQRWSSHYADALRQLVKWHYLSRNFRIRDVVVLHESTIMLKWWILFHVNETHPGASGLVQMVTFKTPTGIHKCQVTKVAVLLPAEKMNWNWTH